MRRYTKSTRSFAASATLTAVLLSLAAPLAAQESSGPSHSGFDPTAPMGAHYHEGEIGERLLIVERNIKCNCSCGLDVHSCQFQMQCGVSPGWTERIRASLEAGQSVEAVEASFVADYGLTVLMSPPPEGFNLVGYLLPAFAIIMAGVLVGLIARGNTSRQALAPVTEVDDETAARLKDALRQLDEAEGPDW